MRVRVATSVAALALSGLAVPVALADDPPPITVPAPTVPAPQPDPGPVSKPRPKTTPQPRPTVHRPAASPSPTVTPRYTPPATVAPKPRASSHPHQKRLPVKHPKPKAKPATTKPAVTQQGVTGAEKTPVAPPVAHQDTSSGANWGRAALFLLLALILGAVAVLRHRRVHPREVEVEVMQPQALRAVAFPLGRAFQPAPTQEASVAPEAERPPEQLLADIAPPATEEHDTEIKPEPEPVQARPPFHDPALGAALESPESDADDVAMTHPTEEICTIAIWHGYVKSRFYAGLIGDDEQGIEYALAESEPIRVRGNGTPERTQEAEKAHQALVARLIESGWEVEPPVNGESWHALRLHRAVARAESSSA
jgi:hypothetical protein